MDEKKLLRELSEVRLAIELIELGARLTLLESETSLPRTRLLRLYKEVSGASPSKGLLPFSEDWFFVWNNNIHASLFYAYFQRLTATSELPRIDALMKAYKLYVEQVTQDGHELVLDITRAWTLLRFFDAKIMKTASCNCCGGNFVMHAQGFERNFVCVICQPPARAGQGKEHLKRQRAQRQLIRHEVYHALASC